MSINQVRSAICASLSLAVTISTVTHGQETVAQADPSAAQLKAALPDAQDLQGFVHIRPAYDTPARIKAETLPDRIRLRTTVRGNSGQTITISSIARILYSQDEVYWIHMALTVYESAATAHTEVTSYRNHTQQEFQPLPANPSSDDETWFNVGPTPGSTLLIRRGRVKVLVEGALTGPAIKAGGHEAFSPESVLAIGHMIELRLARQPGLTSTPAQDARVAVNGTDLPAHAALVTGKQVYVPVTEFAKAAGWQSQWDVTTGVLTLTNPAQQQITLAAGSTAVKEPGTTAAALKCPVLKEADHPVMLLDDLLTLTKGRVTSREGNSFKITV